MGSFIRWILFLLAVLVIVLIFVWWQSWADKGNPLVVYFGRPADVITYLTVSWQGLLIGSISTFGVAGLSLFLSGLLAGILLKIGLHSEKRLKMIENISATSQTVPMLVVVALVYIAFKAIIRPFNWSLPYQVFCIPPVTFSLFFAPLVYGAKGVVSIDSQMKALLRIWGAPQKWRINRVYRLCALSHILAGIRVSSTWAVAATLITEGLVFESSSSGNSYSLGRGLLTAFSGSSQVGKTPALIMVATLLGYFVYLLTVRAEAYIQKRVYGSAFQNEIRYPISN